MSVLFPTVDPVTKLFPLPTLEALRGLGWTKGDPGTPGAPGLPGKDGKDGLQGLQGLPGEGLLRGTGFPNGVVAAPVGTLYSDNAVTNGASLWQKIAGTGTSGWKVVSGDTGWRNLKSLLNPAWSVETFPHEIAVRRVNDAAYWKFLGTKVLAENRLLVAPTGFVPSGYGSRAVAVDTVTFSKFYSVFSQSTPAEMRVGAGGTYPGSVPVGELVSFEAAAPISDTWPSTLPGTN